MKVFICLFAVLAVTQASVNWDNVHPAKLTPYPNGIPDVHLDEEDIERIVGGEEVVPHSRPFQVAVLTDLSTGQTAFCGGSLISRNCILTAAHCVDEASPEDVEVVLGAHNIRDENEPGQVRIRAAEVTVHPGWSRTFLTNDVAIIRLPAPVELNANISTIALPSRQDVRNKFTGNTATVSGWGKDSDSATAISPVLRQTSNPVLSRLACMARFPIVGLIIRSSHLCVSGSRGHSSCNGDSGGPLTTVRDNEQIQIGLVSFGSGMGCSLRFPHVYTRLTEFLDWIAENSDAVIH